MVYSILYQNVIFLEVDVDKVDYTMIVEFAFQVLAKFFKFASAHLWNYFAQTLIDIIQPLQELLYLKSPAWMYYIMGLKYEYNINNSDC